MAAAGGSAGTSTVGDPVLVVLRMRMTSEGLPAGSLSVENREAVTFEGWLALMAGLRRALEEGN